MKHFVTLAFASFLTVCLSVSAASASKPGLSSQKDYDSIDAAPEEVENPAKGKD